MRKGRPQRAGVEAAPRDGPPDDALILMGKAPLPGTVKTRLCPPLSPAEAADLFSRMLADTAREMERVRAAARYLAFWPPGALGSFRAAAFAAFRPMAQRGAALGERIANAASDAFRRGHRRVVVVGSDCPALSAARVRAAFRELRDGAFAVIGPSGDGGFYLIGFSAPAPELFRGVPWSGPRVLSQVVANLRSAGRTFSMLAAESDVDTPEDLAALRRWAKANARPSCPGTRAWLRRPSALSRK